LDEGYDSPTILQHARAVSSADYIQEEREKQRGEANARKAGAAWTSLKLTPFKKEPLSSLK